VHRRELRELISEQRVVIIGPVRQEILSGIRSQEQFESIRDRLRVFADVPIAMADHELAAAFFNTCRGHGIQGSNTDFLICAIAVNRDFAIYTTDKDFVHYRKHLPVRLYQPRDFKF
jgi:predicted nucleic acid-binding protein